MKYILLALITFSFFACNTVDRQNAKRKISNEILDTIKMAPGNAAIEPALFENAFIKGTTHIVNVVPINFYGVTIGKLKVTSGRIIACDPLHTDEYGIPFTYVFPPGEFPVQLSIAQTGDGDLVAFARIKFSDEPVAKWELAVQRDQKKLPVGNNDYEGFGIDGGIGIFVDDEAKKALDKSNIIDDALYEPLMKEMDKHYHNTWRYTLYNFSNYNLAAFTTGMGDGRYATYIGFDTAGKPCRLLSDFNLFEWRKNKNNS